MFLLLCLINKLLIYNQQQVGKSLLAQRAIPGAFNLDVYRSNFPSPVIETMLNDQKGGVKLTSVTCTPTVLSGHSFSRLEEFVDTFR